MESNAFDPAIHNSIFDLCRYKKEAPIEDRGTKYFIEKLKAEENDDNLGYG